MSGDKITHARFAAQRIKDAIVDRMRDEGLERPSVNTDLPDVRVNLSLRKGRASCRSTSAVARCIAVAGAVPPTRRR